MATTGTAPNVQYDIYMAGEQAIGAVSLANNGPNFVEDPSQETFKLRVLTGESGREDPEGVIAASVAYNFVYVAKDLFTSNLNRRAYTIIEADASRI